MSLDIPIDACEVHVRLRKPVRCLKVWWPMTRIDQWVKYLASHQPRLLLGGQLPDPNGKWKEMFSKFWSDYKVLNGDHPIFHRGDVDLGACLPYFIHGDEGRGQLKRPYMVVSIQLAIGHGGPEVCNDTGYRGCIGIAFMFGKGVPTTSHKDIFLQSSNNMAGIPLQADFCSLAYPVIYITMTGPSMTCWASWQSKPLTHTSLVFVTLGKNFVVCPSPNQYLYGSLLE